MTEQRNDRAAQPHPRGIERLIRDVERIGRNPPRQLRRRGELEPIGTAPSMLQWLAIAALELAATARVQLVAGDLVDAQQTLDDLLRRLRLVIAQSGTPDGIRDAMRDQQLRLPA